MRLPPFDPSLFLRSFKRLDPRHQIKNPVMFAVYCGAVLITLDGLAQILGPRHESLAWGTALALTLWLTVYASALAEQYAEDQDQAQALALKKAHGDDIAKKMYHANNRHAFIALSASHLKKGDPILIEAGDTIPADGDIIEGIASIDESAITGESAPVIRESGGDNRAVICGTRLLSDWIVVRVTSFRGETPLDKRLAMMKKARRQKTPNELALSLFLIATTLGLLVACATLRPLSSFLIEQAAPSLPISLSMLVSLFVCLAPTTIGGLMPAIGLAGSSRLLRAGVIATSGHAVETAGDITLLLLDKTGTITLGNRQAVAFYAAEGIAPIKLVKASVLASLADKTPEGQSIIVLAQTRYGVEPAPPSATMLFIPFSADTRVSGVTLDGRTILKGADDAIKERIVREGGRVPASLDTQVETIARQGGTPLMVAENAQVLGVIHLKDVVKKGIKERLATLRIMGVRSLMITGDNPLTAAAIAAEAGVDDFIAQAIPETKLRFITEKQKEGEVVAMVGDGANDAPALAGADIGIAMDNGSQEAKEAANMVDMDSSPSKLVDIVQVGRQLLMTRGSLATFSIAGDIGKFLILLPAVLISAHPSLSPLNFMNFSSPHYTILSALLFNALIIVALIPVAMRGVAYRPVGAGKLLRRNLLVYGLGGIAAPFIGIKLIDMAIALIVKGLAHV